MMSEDDLNAGADIPSDGLVPDPFTTSGTGGGFETGEELQDLGDSGEAPESARVDIVEEAPDEGLADAMNTVELEDDLKIVSSRRRKQLSGDGFGSRFSSAIDAAGGFCGQLPIIRKFAGSQSPKTICLGICAVLAVIVFLAVIFAVATGGGSSGSSDNSNDMSKAPFRGCVVNSASPWLLPDGVNPVEYDVALKPDLHAATTLGSVDLTLTVDVDTTCIALNAKDIQLSNVVVSPGDYEAANIWFTPDEREMVFLHFPAGLRASVRDYTLSMDFESTITDDMEGFYRANFTEGEDVKHIGVTQFEPTYARRAFPCMDQPDKKAKFKLTIEAPNSMIVRSNMPVATVVAAPGSPDSSLHMFEKSVKMSTYLVAWIIGEFDFVEATAHLMNSDIPVRVYTMPGQGARGQFAVDWGAEVVAYLSQTLDYDFVIPKLDMAAIPDFEAGAMENWGLITFRDTAILSDSSSSTSQLQYVASVVAHELVHQWFGNLVTTKWWSDLWLNEGFATYFSYYAVDALRPDWDSWGQYLVEELLVMYDVDALEQTHSIVNNNVHFTGQINEMFDSISYNKGSALLRMIESYVERVHPGGFIGGLQAYLKKYAFSNTLTADLFNEWQTILNEADFTDRFQTWSHHPGYPLVTAEVGNDPTVLQLSQERFLFSGTANESMFWIPISVHSSVAADDVYLSLSEDSSSYVLPNALPSTAGEYYKLNTDVRGLYKVNYKDDGVWGMLKDAAIAGDLSTDDMFGLVDDLFVLARARDVPLESAMDVLYALENTDAYAPWATVAYHVTSLRNLLDHLPVYGPFSSFVLDRAEKLYTTIGWGSIVQEGGDDDGVSVNLLRQTILPLLDYFDHPGVIAKAREIYDSTAPEDINPNIRGTVFTSVVRHGGATEYYAMRKLYEGASSQAEQSRTRSALASTRVPWLLVETLDYAMSSKVRAQDSVFLIREVARNSYGHTVAWDWIRSHWDELNNRYGTGMLIGRLVATLSQFFYSDVHYDEVKQFFEANVPAAGQMAVKSALEQIRSNGVWLDEHVPTLLEWLDERTSTNGTIPDEQLTPYVASIVKSGIRVHLESLQQIADDNDNNRFTGSSGFNDTVDYIVNTLQGSTDYVVSVQHFDIPYAHTVGTPTLDFTDPVQLSYAYKEDFNALSYSGGGQIDQAPIAIAENLGCSDDDFAAVPAGRVVFVMRGDCPFHDKAAFAVAHGAVAVVIFNDAARRVLFHGTLNSQMTVPVLGTSYEVGFIAGLLVQQNNDPKISIDVEVENRVLHASNVIADSPDGDGDSIVMAGSHMDSVEAGPGLNDNGSGTSALLAMALQSHIYLKNPVNKLRFAWWGGEELGLLGSKFYVENLNETNRAELDKIALYTNYDMLGSPNFIRAMYNASTSPETAVVDASTVIQHAYEESYLKNFAFTYKDMDGRSDYDSFVRAGIPAGGLDTGAEVVKTQEERRVFGGLANTAYDPCYHQACDTIDNVNEEVLEQMARAAADVLEGFAMDQNLRNTLHG